MDNNLQAFFELIRAGLWEQGALLLPFRDTDFAEVQRLAEEQSVVGLITAGLEHVTDMTVPKEVLLQFIGLSLQLEHQNKQMNTFIEGLVDRMRMADIYTLLVKGQGIAQCYERPLWRSCGDVDFFLDNENYEKAKRFFIPLAISVEPERVSAMHLGMTILETFGTSGQDQAGPWVVELHGSLRCGLSKRIDKGLDEIKNDVFHGGIVRTWINGGTPVFLLKPDEDAIYVFTHILEHFYKGGIGIRQICDWCRLLWTYREEIDHQLLEKRLRKMGLVSEWKAFGAFTVEYLGMPADAMPLYSAEEKWKKKADRICKFVMEVGNFGHNRDNSYYEKYPYVIRKAISLGRRVGDLFRHAHIFPLDSLRFFPNMMFSGLRSAAKGEG